MRLAIALAFGLLSAGGSTAEPTTTPPPNVLLICVDDLRPELNHSGATHIHSPHIDRLAAAGRSFQRHYVNAPSCGPSRFSMLTGLYPVKGRSNQHLTMRAKEMAQDQDAYPPSMPEWFRRRGYTTVSVGKVSHHPGGRYGEGWADETKPELPGAWDRHGMPVGNWGNPQGTMHGYAHGKTRVKGSGENFLFEAVEGPDAIYPDGLIAQEGLKQLDALAAAAQATDAGPGKPFFLAIGLIKPHLPFGAPQRYLDLYDGVAFPDIPHPQKPEHRSTWHRSGEFMGYDRWERDPRHDAEFADAVRRHYAACVSYADKHVGDVLNKLKETGADQNTVVVLWGDHGWHLGEHAIWGKHSLFEESLHAPLIVSYPGLPSAGQASDAVVETIDLFPTLCELAGLPVPDFAPGRSLKPMLDDPTTPGHTAVGYRNQSKTIRTTTHRLIEHADGYVELYDHTTPEGETKNVAADQPEVVAALCKRVAERLRAQAATGVVEDGARGGPDPQ